MDIRSSQTSKDIISFTGWDLLEKYKPQVDDTEYVKELLEDIGLAMTCSFVDLGILLRTFKTPINRQTQQPEPTPFLSIAYFGDDHMKTLLNVLVKQLKVYELVPGSVDRVKTPNTKALRCLSLSSPASKVFWNLQQEAKRIGVDIQSFKKRRSISIPTIVKTRSLKSKRKYHQSRRKSHRRSNKVSRRRSI
jgi:hypothetical protein